MPFLPPYEPLSSTFWSGGFGTVPVTQYPVSCGFACAAALPANTAASAPTTTPETRRRLICSTPLTLVLNRFSANVPTWRTAAQLRQCARILALLWTIAQRLEPHQRDTGGLRADGD